MHAVILWTRAQCWSCIASFRYAEDKKTGTSGGAGDAGTEKRESLTSWHRPQCQEHVRNYRILLDFLQD